MSGYLLSPAARADLEAIWDSTTERWGPAQAERYFLTIRDARDAREALAAGRKQGGAVDDIRPGYRKLVVGSHSLFFRTNDAGLVEVICILHQRMEVPSHFRG